MTRGTNPAQVTELHFHVRINLSIFHGCRGPIRPIARLDIAPPAPGDAATCAGTETCDYIESKMPDAIGMKNQASCIRYALGRVGAAPGVYLEFGVYRGTTIRIIGDICGAGRHVHGFDSFEGLPTDWFGNSLKAGDFDVLGKLPRVRANTTLHKGWFEDTLPRWCEDHPDKVAFLNIDSDLYSSAELILGLLGDRLQEGTIIHFDEYLNYPGWQHHEFRAWQEFVASRGVEYTYIAYSRWGAVVRIDKAPKAPN